MLEILVENPGRINFGEINGQRMGLSKSPCVNGMKIESKWNIISLPFSEEEILQLDYSWNESSLPVALPAFFSASLEIPGKPADTFIEMEGWGKGVIFVNGRNLGRYWVSAGPQKTLYLPGCWLKSGQNKIVWFEEEQIGSKLFFRNEPDLGERDCGDDVLVSTGPSTTYAKIYYGIK